LQTEGESGPENAKTQRGNDAERHRVGEVKLSGAAFALGKENNIHAVRSECVQFPVSAGRQRNP
jgi:hypothetical protein